MKTPTRMKPKAMSPGANSSAPANSCIISAPASGKTAYAATSLNTSRRGWRRRMPSTITAVTAIATAGAGPSRAIASTRLMNDPQMRRLPVSNGNRWLPTDSAAMSTTRPTGCHWSAVESAQAATRAASAVVAWNASVIRERGDLTVILIGPGGVRLERSRSRPLSYMRL